MVETGNADHVPVLLDAALDALALRPDGVYVDATFGRGGHSRAILGQLGPQGRVIAFDRDPQAVAAAAAIDDARFTIAHERFSSLPVVLQGYQIDAIDGVLFDLGVSSPQLDDPERGFSFMRDGPLDMRMDPGTGESAAHWLARVDEQQLAEVIKRYGEERFAGAIAKAIVARQSNTGGAALQTTGQLADLVAGIVRRRSKGPALGKNPATRTFQAIRLFINQELEELSLVLSHAVDSLRPGGRLVVISFHSLEDRIVKQFIAKECGRNARRDPISGQPVHDRSPRLTRAMRVLPDAREAERNVRARSAVLRSAERTDSAGHGADRIADTGETGRGARAGSA